MSQRRAPGNFAGPRNSRSRASCVSAPYEVSFTMGNTTPIADLMAVSPVGREMFLVDVKGYRRNLFLVKRTPANARLY